MQVNSIFTTARSQAHVTEEQYPNATLIDWLNDFVYKPVLRRIMAEAQINLLASTRQIDAVAAQSSYNYGTNMGVLKQIKVKPTADAAEFVVSREIDFNKQDYNYEYFAVNQPSNDYRHQITGSNSFLLAPRFTSDTAGSAGNNQIELAFDALQSNLAVGGAESTIAIHPDFHYILALGLKPLLYSGEGKTNEKNDAKAEFENALDDVLYVLRGRDDTANYLSTPNDEALQ